MLPRPLVVLAVCCATAGCDGGPPRDGLFNNQPGWSDAVESHRRSWIGQVGTIATARAVQAALAPFPAHCIPTDGKLECTVEVRPRRPALFTKRRIWTVTFAPLPGRRLALRDVSRTDLGWDI